MNDPFEDQLRSTLRQVASHTTTSHDLGLPVPPPRPSRSKRLIATSALSVMALTGGGIFLATRGDNSPQTVSAAAGDTTNAPETTMPSIGAALANICADTSASGTTPLPLATGGPAGIKAIIGQMCAGGGLMAANPLAACGIDAGALKDLLAPLMSDLAPQLAQLKPIIAEFEPRIRALTSDPAVKAQIDAEVALLKEKLGDPANRPDLSDPAARQQLYDELKAGLAPLENNAALKAQVESLVTDLHARLDALAATPDGQALEQKLKDLAQDPALKQQAQGLADKLQACLPH